VPSCCNGNTTTSTDTRLPRWQHETSTYDNIPLMAIVTGSADPIECVLPKIGLTTTSKPGGSSTNAVYTNPSGTGRVRFYVANSGGGGANINSNTPTSDKLFGSLTEMEKYDVIIADCEGGEYDKSAWYSNIQTYTSKGGRFYASHYEYAWFQQSSKTVVASNNTPQPWSCGNQCSTANMTCANWDVNQGSPTPDPLNALIDTTITGSTATPPAPFQKGIDFSTWLTNVGAATTPGQIPVNAPRHDLDSVIAPAQQWMHSDSNATPAGTPLQFTFNTPFLQQNQCGRVMFSDFHVNTGGSGSGGFPGECGSASAMTAQEKVLEFMLFDLTSCITPDTGPTPMTCTPKTCSDATLMNTCGLQGDGCGNLIGPCKTCTSPQTCGGGGTPNQCGAPSCTPKTCAMVDPSANCGVVGDGCGGLAPCGTCPTGQVCGAGGPNICAATDANYVCTPLTCAALGNPCGQQGDGCGGTINCMMCTPPQTCGGGGMPGVCGAPNCTPTTCAAANANCGKIGDGCGGSLDCGTCTSPYTCGGGGVANQCGVIG
jgi:hypothetical protein